MLVALLLCASTAAGQTDSEPASPPGAEREAILEDDPVVGGEPSKLFSPDDGWFDVSGFLEEKYGFLPLVLPITEPATGYGAAGALAFLSKPLGAARDGLGRPSITAVGGLGTENGTWAAAVGDLRYWLDDRLQTQVGAIYGSANLDFFGIGEDSALNDDPLSYNLEPKGGMVQGKYRLGDTRFWGGLGYAIASTRVSFDAPPGTPGLPDFERDSNVGGLTPSVTYDSRDNMFTPLRGTYVEGSAGLFSRALGGDSEHQRARLIAMHFIPLHPQWTLGLRGDVGLSFGDAPFYMRPYISLRGAPVLRYQGEETAQLEAEVRWQFWERFSLVGFVGGGAAWNDLERLDDTQTVVTGGSGIRYEIAREYGIHMGLDVAFGPDDVAVYVQIGSAWARP